MTRPKIVVSDVSVLMDLARARLIEAALALPFDFVIPDVIFIDRRLDLGTYASGDLVRLGLRVGTLDGRDTSQALAYFRKHRRQLSLNDCFALRFAELHGGILMIGSAYIDPDALEPWYQYVIEGLMVIASPIIGIHAQETAHEINGGNPVGFGGINRLHFLWLWFAAFWYTVGLISPIVRHFMMDESLGIITFVQDVVVNGIPAVALLVPGYYGLALLSGHRGPKLHPAARNLLGVVVLIFGFVIGAVIQYGWQRLFQWLFG